MDAMAQLGSVMFTEALGENWLRAVLARMQESEATAVYLNDGPQHTKHIWMAGKIGLHHTVVEKDPARAGYFRPIHRLHSWRQVEDVDVTFEGIPNNASDWVVRVSITEPAFVRVAASGTTAAQELIDFGMACARLTG